MVVILVGGGGHRTGGGGGSAARPLDLQLTLTVFLFALHYRTHISWTKSHYDHDDTTNNCSTDEC